MGRYVQHDGAMVADLITPSLRRIIKASPQVPVIEPNLRRKRRLAGGWARQDAGRHRPRRRSGLPEQHAGDTAQARARGCATDSKPEYVALAA